MLDTIYRAETPESIELEAELAGPVVRVLAYTIDLCFRLVVLTVIGTVMQIFGNVGLGLMMIITFLMEWFYPVVFEVMRRGQTPGKSLMGITVVNIDLTPVSWSSSVVRNLLRVADFMPFFYMGGLISMSVSRHFQRFGDFAAGTLVIYKKDRDVKLTLPDVQAVPPPVALDLEEQQALINFTQRHRQLSQPRQEELAMVLENFGNKKSESRITYLRGIGNWLLGDR